jgi:very-short-patch-repair endonuclease
MAFTPLPLPMVCAGGGGAGPVAAHLLEYGSQDEVCGNSQVRGWRFRHALQVNTTHMPLPKNARNRAPENQEWTRKLRREMTISEKKLWDYLQKSRTGFSFRRQFGVGVYSLDFYCPEVKVCVEVDGPHHEHRWFEDKARDQTLSDLGIHVIRIPSIELFDDRLQGWLKRIRDACLQRRMEALRNRNTAKRTGTSTPGPVSREMKQDAQ